MPSLALMYDRAGKPYKILASSMKWSNEQPQAVNGDKNVLNYTGIFVANVQNGSSHVGQFDNANANAFRVSESRKYYDTTKLKRKGR